MRGRSGNRIIPGTCPSVFLSHTPALASSMQTLTLPAGPIFIDMRLSSVAAEGGWASLVPLGHITGAGPLPNLESLGPLGGCARRAIGRARSGLHVRCSAPCRFPACMPPHSPLSLDGSQWGTLSDWPETKSRRRPIPPNLGPLSAEFFLSSLGRSASVFFFETVGWFGFVSFPLSIIVVYACWRI